MQGPLNLLDLLPHREPMLLLDELVEVSSKAASAWVHHNKANIFASPNQATPSWVGIEYMAQTACLVSGYQYLMRGEQPRLAFLLGSRCYKASCDEFGRGQSLLVKASADMFDNESGVVLFHCTIEDEKQELATAALKAIRPPDTQAFLNNLDYI